MEEKSDRLQLAVPRETAIETIQNQIAIGKSLLCFPLSSAQEISEADIRFREWAHDNIGVLSILFEGNTLYLTQKLVVQSRSLLELGPTTFDLQEAFRVQVNSTIQALSEIYDSLIFGTYRECDPILNKGENQWNSRSLTQ